MLEFLKSESGAITVDWVVLSSAVTGLGMAVTGVVSGGIENLSNDTASTLASTRFIDRFAARLSTDDFSDGRGDWVGGIVTTINGFGEVLALSGNADEAQLQLNVPEEYDYAVVEFDMILGDSWDIGNNRNGWTGAEGSIEVNGEQILLSEFDIRSHDEPVITTFEDSNGSITTVQLTRTSDGTGNTSAGWTNNNDLNSSDYTYNVRIVTENSGSDLTVGASTTLDQGHNDEFFALDNVTVSGADAPS